MKIGIILIFSNCVIDLHKKTLKNSLSLIKLNPLCFVNNGSNDKVLILLESIKDSAESNVVVVNVKRNRGNDLAVKAGARCLFNAFNLNYVGYLIMDSQTTYERVNHFISTLEVNNDLIHKYNVKRMYNKKYQRTWFKNIFSILGYLDFLHKDSKLNTSNLLA